VQQTSNKQTTMWVKKLDPFRLEVTQGHWKWLYSIDRIHTSSSSVVTMSLSSTVTDIFSIEYAMTLKSGLGSFKVIEKVPIDRSYTTLYWFAVITLSCTIFELFDVQNIATLKSYVSIQSHFRTSPSPAISLLRLLREALDIRIDITFSQSGI